MNPSGLHLTGHNSPVSSLVKFINKANHYKNMHTDEDDSGGYVNIDKWTLLDINRKTDSRGRIHVNEINIGKDIRVFVSDANQELETCNNKILLPYPTYIEIRKTRVKNKIGEYLTVQNNGDVWTGSVNKNKFVKIFVRK
jgi:hypothetical protein